MFVHNVRYGFATNSSSTHSIILLQNGIRVDDDQVEADEDGVVGEFGWNFFTCASRDAKLQYLGQTLLHTFTSLNNLPCKDAATLASAWCGIAIDPNGYIDHQSLIALPTERHFDGHSIQKEFFDDLMAFILREDVAILGGNDNNKEDHPLLANESVHKLTHRRFRDDEIGNPALNLLRETSSEHLRARYDSSGKFWTLFSKDTGTKVRISFALESNADKSEAPELIDIKITDYCNKGCYYCVDPTTKVLTKDLVWTSINTLDIGQDIVAFDEVAPIDNSRKLRTATITDKWSVNKPAIKVTTEHSEIIVSEDHRFVCGDWRWRKASYLRIGSRILSCQPWDDLEINDSYWVGYLQGMTAGDGTCKLLPTPEQRQIWWRITLSNTDGLEAIIQALDTLKVPHNGIKLFDSGSPLTKKQMYKVELRSSDSVNFIRNILARNLNDRSFKAGWLAGFYDAEGSVDKNNGVIRIYQVQHNENLNIACEFLTYFGFDSVIEENSIRLRGGRFSVLRFFGIVRPKILDKVRLFNGEGANWVSSRVVKLEQLESQELIDITTTTKTFIANGMAVHNCYQGSTPSGVHADDRYIQNLSYQLREIGVFEVSLGGGEPTQHPNLMSIIDSFHYGDMVVNITTRNEDWVIQHYHEIKGKVRAIGLSVDSNTDLVQKLSKLRAAIPRIGFSPRHGFSGDELDLTVQVVVGACSESALESIFETCKTFNITVLLLGWKNTHRGAKGPKNEIDLIKFLDQFWGPRQGKRGQRYKPWKGPSVSFDTPLVNQMADWLSSNADSWHFTTREGSHSMYIDCVTHTMHRSSYDTEQGVPVSDAEGIKRYFAQI